MKVKDCLLLAGELLGLDGAITDLNAGSSTSEETQTLLRCFQLVQSELALDYLPLFAEDEVETETGAVFFSELTYPPVRILKITGKIGGELDFTLFPEYVKTEAGKLKVRYTYAPTEKTIDDECDFALGVSTRLVAYGVASEYALAVGLYEEANVWEKKYKDAISAVYRLKRAKPIKSRRWV